MPGCGLAEKGPSGKSHTQSEGSLPRKEAIFARVSHEDESGIYGFEKASEKGEAEGVTNPTEI